MSIRDEVTSLPLSQKLKELGVKQDSLFLWVKNPQDEFVICFKEDGYFKPFGKSHIYYNLGLTNYSAYLSSELGRMLPYRLRNININPLLNDDFWMKIEKLKHDNCFEIRYVSVKGVTVTEIIQNINLVNCLGYKLVELIKFNHVKPEDI